MNSIDLKRRALELSEKTNAETISPTEVGGIKRGNSKRGNDKPRSHTHGADERNALCILLFVVRVGMGSASVYEGQRIPEHII